MKRWLKLLGMVLIALGTIWVLQGIDLLPGSFMSGQRRWAWRGAVAVLVGGKLLVVATRRGSDR